MPNYETAILKGICDLGHFFSRVFLRESAKNYARYLFGGSSALFYCLEAFLKEFGRYDQEIVCGDDAHQMFVFENR